jgi:hypothetical protein
MLPMLEHAAVGAALVTLAAIGLARAAVHFQRFTGTEDRFFSTSFVSVALVALLVGGAFYLGRAAFEAEGLWQPVVAAGGIAVVVLVPTAIWQWFGPRTTEAAGRRASA